MKILVQRFLRAIRTTKIYSNHISKIHVGVYSTVFNKYLLLTNTATCSGLMFVADIVEQEIEYRRKLINHRYDWNRAVRMGAIGIVLGPIGHYFYKHLDRILPGTAYKTVLSKVAVDQIVMAPILITAFFYGVNFMEGRTWKECHDDFTSKFVKVYLVDCCIWPASQFLNFYYMPTQYRVIYISVVSAFYDVFLSYIKHVDKFEKQRQSNEYAANSEVLKEIQLSNNEHED